MNTMLLFWVFIAILGVILYSYPGILVKVLQEGFQTQQQQPPQQPIEPAQIDNLQKLLSIPDFVESPTATSETSVETNGLQPIPKEYETTKSKPSNPILSSDNKISLKQGESFQSIGCTQPSRPRPRCVKPSPPRCVRPRPCVKPSPPSCIRPSPSPSPPGCPKCPNMSDYIRKDSIPCWGCKLK